MQYDCVTMEDELPMGTAVYLRLRALTALPSDSHHAP